MVNATSGAAAASYDMLHRATTNPLMAKLWARAFGASYPPEVDPFSSCSWWTLGHAISALRMRPGQLLVDLGCGRGGPGLWLARALSVRLVGVDFSPAAVALARVRVPRFLPADRAEFRVGTLTETGLADAAAHGLISVDALPFAADLKAAFAELRRVLAPRARAVLSVREAAFGDDRTGYPWSRWLQAMRYSGLRLEHRLVDHDRTEHWHALYALWCDYESELRREIGDEVTELLLAEARAADRLAKHRPLLLVVRRTD